MGVFTQVEWGACFNIYRGYGEPGVEGYLPYKFFKTVNLRKYKDHEKIVNDLKVSSSKKKNL